MRIRSKAFSSTRCGLSDAGPRGGVAAVELALVAPFLFTIFLGMCEMSRAMMVQQRLSNAASTGCRTGIQRDKGNTDVHQDVQNILEDHNIPLGAVTTTIAVTDPRGSTVDDSLGAPTGSLVSVQVSIPVSAVSWVTSNFLQSSMLLSETVVMMKQ